MHGASAVRFTTPSSAIVSGDQFVGIAHQLLCEEWLAEEAAIEGKSVPNLRAAVSGSRQIVEHFECASELAKRSYLDLKRYANRKAPVRGRRVPSAVFYFGCFVRIRSELIPCACDVKAHTPKLLQRKRPFARAARHISLSLRLKF
jgi:hypothetical protein